MWSTFYRFWVIQLAPKADSLPTHLSDTDTITITALEAYALPRDKKQKIVEWLKQKLNLQLKQKHNYSEYQ